MCLDFRVVVKLLLGATEPLDESDWTSGPDCEEAINIPVYVEDDSVVINLLVPQYFVPSAVNKFDLAFPISCLSISMSISTLLL